MKEDEMGWTEKVTSSRSKRQLGGESGRWNRATKKDGNKQTKIQPKTHNDSSQPTKQTQSINQPITPHDHLAHQASKQTNISTYCSSGWASSSGQRIHSRVLLNKRKRKRKRKKTDKGGKRMKKKKRKGTQRDKTQ